MATRTTCTPDKLAFDMLLVREIDQMHRNGYELVHPVMLQTRLDFYRAEWTLRKDFYRLVDRGFLVRPGGYKSKRGYRVAPYWRRKIQRNLGRGGALLH